MAEIEETMSIAGSPAQVWAALGDYGAISVWAPNVDHSCLTTDQRTGAGCVRRVQVGRNALLERVVEWQAGERLAYSIEGLPPVVRSAVNTWVLEEDGEATIIALTTRIDTGPRPPQKAVARVLGKVMARVSREMLTGLKKHVERTDATNAHGQKVGS